MRRVIVAAMVSLDGVMQAPGGPDEDRSGGFQFGGWTAPWVDEASMEEIMGLFAKPFDLLLGRRTYEIFAAYWPHSGPDRIGTAFNRATKYVASRRGTDLPWQPAVRITDAAIEVAKLKQSQGPPLLTQGSSQLAQDLLAAGLVDELHLFIFPVTLGKGKRLFGDATHPATWKPTRTAVLPNGVIHAAYERAGKVATGTVGA